MVGRALGVVPGDVGSRTDQRRRVREPGELRVRAAGGPRCVEVAGEFEPGNEARGHASDPAPAGPPSSGFPLAEHSSQVIPGPGARSRARRIDNPTLTADDPGGRRENLDWGRLGMGDAEDGGGRGRPGRG